jgi:hypothetical protein
MIKIKDLILSDKIKVEIYKIKYNEHTIKSKS